jgi:hypothetical protein
VANPRFLGQLSFEMEFEEVVTVVMLPLKKLKKERKHKLWIDSLLN